MGPINLSKSMMILMHIMHVTCITYVPYMIDVICIPVNSEEPRLSTPDRSRKPAMNLQGFPEDVKHLLEVMASVQRTTLLELCVGYLEDGLRKDWPLIERLASSGPPKP